MHHATYYPLWATYPNLVSDLHVQVRVKATDAIKRGLTLQKTGRKVRQPHSDACPPRYNVHTYRVDWESQTVRMSLAGGRQTICFSVPDYSAKYAGYPVATADLIETQDLASLHGRWWLHVVVTVPAPEVAPTDQVIGVDLGLAHPAVTSHNRFLGKQSWKAGEGRYFNHIRALQQRGTKSAKRRLKQLRHTRARFRRDCDHVLSKQIMQVAEPGSTIVLENLKAIRKRVNARRKPATKRRIHGWSFAHLKACITYKAEERGCTVVGVDPRHTSQTCSCCGHTARTNRRSRGTFICRACGYHLHADLNAARTIVAKGAQGRSMLRPYRASVRAQGGRSDLGGPSINRPIVSNAVPPALD